MIDKEKQNGQNKCPKCGATDISLDLKTGKLRCNFCRHEFEPEKVQKENSIDSLQGEIAESGASDIQGNANHLITIKCSGCGAEIVIDANEAPSARCHWCRNILSLNEQIPNGAVPDMVLPFKVSKEDAQKSIESYVGKRKFYAHPKFKEEFSTENILGVYLPYMVVDANMHCYFKGKGEIETDRHRVKKDDREYTEYDADLYSVSREFDLTLQGLTVESSKDKLDLANDSKTNNIINAIMPFDTENCVRWDANYIRGFTSEKRDTNIDEIKNVVDTQCNDIARYAAVDTIKEYDRGVRWDIEDHQIKGREWKAAYLPVWLYSYMEKSSKGNLLHYVAVNARTLETVGSVPLYTKKLFAVSALVELLGIIAFFVSFLFVDSDSRFPYVFLTLGIIYYLLIYLRYRNKTARHYHELETKTNVSNLQMNDQYIHAIHRVRNAKMQGANATEVKGNRVKLF